MELRFIHVAFRKIFLTQTYLDKYNINKNKFSFFHAIRINHKHYAVKLKQ